MRILLVALLFAVHLTNIQSQIVYKKYFFGEESQINNILIPVVPNQTYNIDLSTEFVPDWLIIYTNQSETDSISFYIGDYLSASEIANNANYYSGYCEFIYKDSLIQTYNNSNTIPESFTYRYLGEHNGKLRVNFTIPDFMCNLHIKMVGNCCQQTIYNLAVVKELSLDEEPIDTLTINVCEPKQNGLFYDDCKIYYAIYKDFSINTEIFIKNPTCLDSFNGSIHFSKYPDSNLNNLNSGEYHLTISNDFCKKHFDVTLKYQNLCKYYIPNIFNPDLDGENDYFGIFLPEDLPYDLSIFDRWGNHIYNNSLISNYFGWDGTFNGKFCEEGVYIYKIMIKNEILTGTVTLLR